MYHTEHSYNESRDRFGESRNRNSRQQSKNMEEPSALTDDMEWQPLETDDENTEAGSELNKTQNEKP